MLHSFVTPLPCFPPRDASCRRSGGKHAATSAVNRTLAGFGFALIRGVRRLALGKMHGACQLRLNVAGTPVGRAMRHGLATSSYNSLSRARSSVGLEHLATNQGVVGSSPAGRAKYSRACSDAGPFYFTRGSTGSSSDGDFAGLCGRYAKQKLVAGRSG